MSASAEPCPSLSDILRTQARLGAAHVTDHRRRISAEQLDRSSNRCARAFVRAGVRPGDRVALLENNSVEFLEVLFACAKIGAIAVPMNARLIAADVEAILRSCEPRLVVVHADLLGHARAAAASAGLAPDRVWVIDGPDGEDAESYDARCASEAETPSEAEARGSVVCLTFTSGTTGGPKGVMIRHEAFGTFLPEAARSWGLGPESVNLVVLPMFHIGGISWFAGGFLSGADTILMRSVDPEQVLDLFERHGVTHTNLVATILRAILLRQEDHPRDVRALSTVTCGGAPIPAAYLRQAQRVLGARFVAFYGLSEAGGGVTDQVLLPEYLEPPLAHRLLSTGRPLAGIGVEIRDPETGSPKGPDEEGEVVVHSPGVMAGYWGRAEDTAAVLDRDGWLRTGDVGRFDPEGFLYLSGRLKEIIISGGENIHPAEIEEVIAEMPGVVEVCVVGVPDDVWGETPVAVVSAAPGSDLTADAVRAWCRDRMARFKCPSAVRIVDSLPRIASGKLARADIRQDLLRK